MIISKPSYNYLKGYDDVLKIIYSLKTGGAKPKVHDVYAVGGCKIGCQISLYYGTKCHFLGGVLTKMFLTKSTFYTFLQIFTSF